MKKNLLTLLFVVIAGVFQLKSQVTIPLKFDNACFCPVTICIEYEVDCPGVNAGLFFTDCKTFSPNGTAGANGIMTPSYTPPLGCTIKINKLTFDNGNGVYTFSAAMLMTGALMAGPNCDGTGRVELYFTPDWNKWNILPLP